MSVQPLPAPRSAPHALSRYKPNYIVAAGDEAKARPPLPLYPLGADDTIIRGLRRAGRRDHRRCRGAWSSPKSCALWCGFLQFAGSGTGRQSDSPISPRKPLPDYIVEKRFPEPIATDAVIAATLHAFGRHADRGNGQAGQRRTSAGGGFFPHRWSRSARQSAHRPGKR